MRTRADMMRNQVHLITDVVRMQAVFNTGASTHFLWGYRLNLLLVTSRHRKLGSTTPLTTPENPLTRIFSIGYDLFDS